MYSSLNNLLGELRLMRPLLYFLLIVLSVLGVVLGTVLSSGQSHAQSSLNVLQPSKIDTTSDALQVGLRPLSNTNEVPEIDQDSASTVSILGENDLVSEQSFTAASPISPNLENISRVFGSLLIVLVTILILALIAKRIKPLSINGASQIVIASTHKIDRREKLLVVEVGTERFLLATGSSGTRRLAQLPSESCKNTNGELHSQLESKQRINPPDNIRVLRRESLQRFINKKRAPGSSQKDA